MKKIVSLILVITIMLLVGCKDVAESDTQINYLQDRNYGYYEIIVDKETGVNYILYNANHLHGTGFTVRLNADGTPYVSGVNGNE